MTKRTYYTCDRCNPNGSAGKSGTVMVPNEQDLRGYDWKRVHDGSGRALHLCAECFEVEPKWRPEE